MSPFQRYRNFGVFISLVLAGVCCSAVSVVGQEESSAEGRVDSKSLLTVGSNAPELNTGAMTFGTETGSPATNETPALKWESGKTYAVVFWHPGILQTVKDLVALDEKIGGSDVTLVAVASCPKSKVEEFLKSSASQETDDELRLTYAELLSGFLLVADEDRSIADRYLLASLYHDIGTTFAVSADGRLAWIGSCTDAAPIIEKIAAGNWDLEKHYELEHVIGDQVRIAEQLLRTGKFIEAHKAFVELSETNLKDEKLAKEITNVLVSLETTSFETWLMSANEEETKAVFESAIKHASKSPDLLYELVNSFKRNENQHKGSNPEYMLQRLHTLNKEMLQREPEQPMLLCSKSMIMTMLGQNPTLVIRELEERVKVAPQKTQVRVRRQINWIRKSFKSESAF